MNDRLFVFLVLISLLFCFLFGVVVTDTYYKDQAIKYDCAHYDPTTSKFIWNKGQ